MQESTKKLERFITDHMRRSSAAKVVAAQLWFGDLDQYAAFIKDETIITGRLRKIEYQSIPGVGRGLAEKSILLVVNNEAYTIPANTEVWVAINPFVVSVTGLYVSEDVGHR